MTRRRASEVAAHRAAMRSSAWRARKDAWYLRYGRICRVCGADEGTPMAIPVSSMWAARIGLPQSVILIACWVFGIGNSTWPLAALGCVGLVVFSFSLCLDGIMRTEHAPIDLHHLRYTVVGYEDDTDLVALCRRHHRQLGHRHGSRPDLARHTMRHIRRRRWWFRLWRPVPPCPWENR